MHLSVGLSPIPVGAVLAGATGAEIVLLPVFRERVPEWLTGADA